MATYTTTTGERTARMRRIPNAWVAGAIALAIMGTFATSASAAGTLSVTKNIPDAPRVTGPGIDCGSDCSQFYGDVQSCVFFSCFWRPQRITVTTSSGNGFRFDAWSNCDTVSSEGCLVEMNGSRIVSASYEDVSDPTVTFRAPGSSEQVEGTVELQATASDNWGIARIEFLVDGVLEAQDDNAPFSAAWDSAAVPDGTHRLAARAVDLAGRTTTVMHDVVVHNTPPPPPEAGYDAPGSAPVAAETAPPDTQISSGPKAKIARKAATFEFGSSEPGSSLECSLDGIGFRSCDSPATYKVPKGSHSFEVRAIDAAGNVDLTPAQWRWKVKPKR